MTFTLGGFGEDIDAAGAEVNIAALQDDHLFTSGDDLRVPTLNQLMALWGGLGSGGAGLMRLQSPSLRRVNRLVVNPLNGLGDADVETNDPIAWMDLHRNPRMLDVDENLRVIIDSNTTAAAFQWLFLALGDGNITRPTGEIIQVHSTGATTVTARAWSSVVVTFADTLPEGRYQVVGLRAVGATMVAARFIFKPGTWRPGAPSMDAQGTQGIPLFRNGGLGVWGEFESTTPPDMEVLCDVADTTQVFEWDLIKVG